ncbi:MAG: FecR family protein, partial [Pseudomonadota bacterium]
TMRSSAATLSVFFFLFFSSPLLAEAVGSVSSVSGEASLTSGDSTQPVKKGDSFSQGDLFELKKGAKVILKFTNGNRITLGSKTRFRVKSYPSEKARTSPSLFELIYGTVRALVKGKSESADFRITTPAAVVGVRGTDFMVSYDPQLKESRCVTFEGVVEFANIDKAGKPSNSVRIAAGQISTVIEDRPPLKPKAVKKERLQKLNNSISFRKDSKDRGQKKNEPPKGQPELRDMKKSADKQSGRMRNNQEGVRQERQRGRDKLPPPKGGEAKKKPQSPTPTSN